MPAPMPLEAPVTTATLPARRVERAGEEAAVFMSAGGMSFGRRVAVGGIAWACLTLRQTPRDLNANDPTIRASLSFQRSALSGQPGQKMNSACSVVEPDLRAG